MDFSGRNRALFYRLTQSTLTLAMAEGDAWKLLTEATEVLELSEDLFLPPSDGHDPEQPTRLLDDTRRRLRNLQSAAKTFLDEQGVHVLHVPTGWLWWTDESRAPGANDPVVVSGAKRVRLVRSPLLFLPVNLEQSARGFRLRRAADVPIEPNLTLLGYLEQFFGIRIAINEDTDIEVNECISLLEPVIRNREHWKLEIASKTPLLRELERSADLIEAQPVLRALCGDPEALLEPGDLRDYAPLDESVQPGEVALAVPADSSQMKAILAVRDGSSLVIQGPPGTGKSQTITNLISVALAEGKQILFVAEKRAARDVVMSNLEQAGIDDMVLHITEEALIGRQANVKKDVAEQFQVILEQGPGKYVIDETSPKEHIAIRDHLNAYVSKLHALLAQFRWSSPFRLMESWATCRDELLASTPAPVPSIHEVQEEWLRAVRETAASVDDLGEQLRQNSRGPWLWMSDQEHSFTDLLALDRALTSLVSYPSVLKRAAELTHFETSSEWTDSEAGLLKLVLSDMALVASKEQSILRLMSPAYWRARSNVNSFLKSGGHRSENATALVQEIDVAASQWRSAFELLAGIYPVTTESLDRTAAVAEVLRSALPSFNDAKRVLRTLSASGLDAGSRNLAKTLMSSLRPGESLEETLNVALYHRWAGEAEGATEEFSLSGNARKRIRDRFEESDKALRDYGRAKALNAFAPTRPGMNSVAPPSSALGVLRSQIFAKRRKPLRWLFTNAADAILRLKPCIVASPLAVAQFLSHRAYQFDLVIFDEASQIPIADSVVAISRGRQVVIVGDSQQMPPTSFFDRVLDPTMVTDDFQFESILQQCEAVLPSRRLLWHYRSRDERLIAFSNTLFYSGDLLTFPSSWANHSDLGVKFEYVSDAIYGRGGSRANPEEAERVVHVLTKEIKNNSDTEIAVTALSTAQQIEIQNRIEMAAGLAPELQSWLDEGGRVKNLETVQGDECDVMILSFGYGKDLAGNLQLNFGPLSRDDGYRRLNVAVTRARLKTILVASIRASDIPPNAVSTGGRLVRQYLDYAERGQVALLENLRADAVDVYQTPFENEVAVRLRALGWSVDTQVGVGKYRIDLGIRDPSEHGRYVAGIECDGATYHSSEWARDRDIVRQQALERLGWRLYRVWSPDWFRDKEAVLADIESFLRGFLPIDELRSDQEYPWADSESTAKSLAERAPVFNSAPGLPAGAVVFARHVPSFPNDALPKHVALIVSREGPLHEDELLAALRADLGLREAGL